MEVAPRSRHDRGEVELSGYSVYGVQFYSDFSLDSPLRAGSGTPDFTLTSASDPPSSRDRSALQLVYTSPYRLKSGEPASLVYRDATFDVMHFAGVADFRLHADRIVLYRAALADRDNIELFFLGDVLSFWLEREGIPVLHSSGLAGRKWAFAFAADCGGGKSTLALTMMRAGYSLLADDIVAVEEKNDGFCARPGYPQVRLWPAEIRHFLGACDPWPQVHPFTEKRRIPIEVAGIGKFHDSAAPLGCIYLPERCDVDLPEITPVSPREGFMALVKASYTPRLAEAAGFQRRRLGIFTRLARSVPIRRLIYPNDRKHLPRVSGAILEDLARLGIHPS